MTPLAPRLKWRAITLATLALAPAFWALAYARVAADTSDPEVADPWPAVAFGLSIIPFVFIVLAFLSEHPRAPGAVLRAMGLSLLVGIPVVAFVSYVTGLVAGVGAGGIAALRRDPATTTRSRVLAVLVVSVYSLVLVQVAGGAVLLPAPAFPLTAIGIADHLAERAEQRAAAQG
jgi:hypothetical protein